jgi:hypothetical protein
MPGPFVQLSISGIPVAWFSGDDNLMDRVVPHAHSIIEWFETNRPDMLILIHMTFHEAMDDPMGIFVVNNAQASVSANIYLKTLNGDYKRHEP